jgi:hypothetical protein
MPLLSIEGNDDPHVLHTAHTESGLVLIVDYQSDVLKAVRSPDHELVELIGGALARASRAFRVPIIPTTIGVQMRSASVGALVRRKSEPPAGGGSALLSVATRRES